ncbi:MFS transporter [Cupriavidus taiwanensis]|uniref:MFS transporter n=1 Tax=Cupriavidus taiwanensis TaxID=164546 RepID=UPI000E15D7CA|nr:MFS transporter [Cupriavidus taiwanensis]SPC17467.1 putative transporter, MFS_1 family [Cupriavidus taiwanensis]
MDRRIYLLTATVFLAGIAENICIGILTSLSTGLGVSLATAGQLTTVFSAIFALTALLASALLTRGDRKTLLLAALGVFALSNGVAAASPGYAVLFGARVLMAASCALVIQLAVMLATALATPATRGRAIGLVFVGISGSLVLGVPAGMVLDQWAGWRAVFGTLALLALLPAALLWRGLPRSPLQRTASLRAYWQALADARGLCAQLVSVAMIGGHFTLFAYLSPYLQAHLGADARALTACYAAFGVAGVTGAWLGGWCSDRIGAWRALLACPAAFCVSMAVLPLAAISPWLLLPALMVWGAISWSVSPIVQNFLVRQSPADADARIGINVAAMHVGVAVGAGLGGVMVDRGALLQTPWLGSAMVALAFGLALAAVRGRRWRAALP